MKFIRKRLMNSRAGFTLAETLIVVLILLMVSAIVGAAIPAASNVYVKTVDAANAQVVLSTSMNLLRNELGTAQEIYLEGTNITYKYIDKYHDSVTDEDVENFRWSQIVFKTDVPETEGSSDGKAVTGIWVLDGKWDTETGKPVFSTDSQRLLLSKEAITKNLSVLCDSVSYDSAAGVVTFGNLRVEKDGKPLDGRETFEVRTLIKDRE